MPIYHGSDLITDIRHGANPITQVWHGGIPIWTRNVTRDDFERDDADDIDPTELIWVDEGPSSDFTIGIENGTARVRLPDGLIGGYFDLRWSRKRYVAATAQADDGYIEVQAATKGNSWSAASMSTDGYNSHVYGRGSNGGYTDGVGIRMRAGHCWIVSRISSTVTVRGSSQGSTFQPGDKLRLVMVGNVHTLFVNGTDVNAWNDAGAVAHKGSGYRSMLMDMAAGKDINGPRRFSPAFDYVLMG